MQRAWLACVGNICLVKGQTWVARTFASVKWYVLVPPLHQLSRFNLFVLILEEVNDEIVEILRVRDVVSAGENRGRTQRKADLMVVSTRNAYVEGKRSKTCVAMYAKDATDTVVIP